MPAAPASLIPKLLLARRRWLVGALAGSWAAARAQARQILQVGPRRALRSLAAAARQARDGCLIEVDAGEYPADVAYWPQHGLHLRAVGGRVHLLAQGASVMGKGIFVTAGQDIRIEGFDFSGAAVADGTGAGIRMDRGSLHLRDCRFRDNQFGLLTNNEADARLSLEDCEFGPVMPGQRHNHNLYVGRIAALRVIGCDLHHGTFGHLLKSRAAFNQLLYSRLSDEPEGRASYELEFPNGGRAWVMGNLIVQSAQTDNPALLAYGAEGQVWPENELILVHNTLIDRRPSGGSFLRLKPGPAPVRVRLLNNLCAGTARLSPASGWEASGNAHASWSDFVDAAAGDYRLRPDSIWRGRSVEAGLASGPEGQYLRLRPERQYQAPRHSVALESAASLSPGAFPFD